MQAQALREEAAEITNAIEYLAGFLGSVVTDAIETICEQRQAIANLDRLATELAK